MKGIAFLLIPRVTVEFAVGIIDGFSRHLPGGSPRTV